MYTKQDSLRVYKVMLPGTRPSINYQSLLKHRDIGPNKLTHASNKPTYSSYLVYDRSHILSGTCLHGLFHSHHDDDQKNGMPHTCSCSFDPTNTWDGRSIGWTNEIAFVLRTHQTKVERGKRSYVERIVPSPVCTIRRCKYHANGILLNNPVML